MKKRNFFLLVICVLSVAQSGAQTSADISGNRKAIKKKKFLAKDFRNSLCIAGTAHYFTRISEPFLQHVKPEKIASYPFNQVADQFGLYYERNIFANFRVGLGYVKWNTFFIHGMPYGSGEEFIYPGAFLDTVRRGNILMRFEYNMADLLIIYRYNTFENIKIDICAGPSYDYGKNDVYDTSYYGHIVASHVETAYYFGIAAGISCDYLCLHKRLSLGYNFKWRKYFELYAAQIDYGFHIKFNF